MGIDKAKTFALVVVIIVTSVTVSFFTAIAVSAQKDRIYPGVSIEGKDLSLLSKKEALKALQDLNEELRAQEVKVMWPEGEGSFKLAEIETKIDIQDILQKAWNLGREGSLIEQWKQRKIIASKGVNLPLKVTYSKDKFLKLMKGLAKDSLIDPKNADIIITDEDMIEIVEGKPGTVIDTDNAVKSIEEILFNNKEQVIELAFREEQPEKDTDFIKNMHVNGLLARFSTFFNIKKTNRVFNIQVAANAMDGHKLKPGDEFSFNEVVGPRSQEAGYKLAPTILNNEFIDSLGGGVCQASTTLYNAVLLAGLEVVERSNHSLVVSYVPLGQDAAVAYGFKDLKFKNNLDCWLVLKTEVEGNRLTVKIFGDTVNKQDIRINNQVIKTYPFKVIEENDPTIPKGQKIIKQKGVNGYKVKSKQIISEGGGNLVIKDIPSSFYKPLNQIVMVGAKKVDSSTASEGKNSETNDENSDVPINEEDIPEKESGNNPATENPEDMEDEMNGTDLVDQADEENETDETNETNEANETELDVTDEIDNPSTETSEGSSSEETTSEDVYGIS